MKPEEPAHAGGCTIADGATCSGRGTGEAVCSLVFEGAGSSVSGTTGGAQYALPATSSGEPHRACPVSGRYSPRLTPGIPPIPAAVSPSDRGFSPRYLDTMYPDRCRKRILAIHSPPVDGGSDENCLTIVNCYRDDGIGIAVAAKELRFLLRAVGRAQAQSADRETGGKTRVIHW